MHKVRAINFYHSRSDHKLTHNKTVKYDARFLCARTILHSPTALLKPHNISTFSPFLSLKLSHN